MRQRAASAPYPHTVPAVCWHFRSTPQLVQPALPASLPLLPPYPAHSQSAEEKILWNCIVPELHRTLLLQVFLV